jgi:tripartite-type tricarboxylate transporter receptor subunit TctC
MNLVAGQIQMMLVGASTGLQYAKDVGLKVIASAPAVWLPVAPALPAIGETYEEFDLSTWYGLVGPAKTPPGIVARLSEEVGRALRAPDVDSRLLALGLIPSPSTPQEFAAKLRNDAEHYARIIKTTGARGE